MSNALSIIPAILIFGLIIFIHELGHFIFARKNGIHVIEFAIGMGPKVISKKFGATIYSFRVFPIGGFCNMLGENEEVDDNGAFSKKAPLARFMVIFGGPLFNFILAFVVAIIVMSMVNGHSTSFVESVIDGSPADLAGIEAGDKIVEINDKIILSAREITMYINENLGEEVEVSVMKASTNEKETLTIKPFFNEEYNYYQVGLTRAVEEKTVFSVVKYAALETVGWIKISYNMFIKLISGQIDREQVSGPIGIVSEIGSSVRASQSAGLKVVIYNLLTMLMIISANIGAMNLLPIPALDGGRLVFILIELIRRKPINKDKEGIVHTIGFAALMLLMAVIMYNDIMKYIVK